MRACVYGVGLDDPVCQVARGANATDLAEAAEAFARRRAEGYGVGKSRRRKGEGEGGAGYGPVRVVGIVHVSHSLVGFHSR